MMARNIHNAKKRRLAKEGKHAQWAPYWIVPKVFGSNRRLHVSRVTQKKRSWRRSRIKV